ncbi:hypothetical protein ACS8E9_09335, partial [Pseudomonas neustonica]|uniref:hypothetical protein n=1 Tax=Pseudomonas neustonica TaxID=2487346 RepID=UPI003F4731AC
LWLTLPLAGRVEDFHLQVSAPCRAHHKKAPHQRGLWNRLEAFQLDTSPPKSPANKTPSIATINEARTAAGSAAKMILVINQTSLPKGISKSVTTIRGGELNAFSLRHSSFACRAVIRVFDLVVSLR